MKPLALLDNAQQLAAAGNDVQVFCRPAINWRQLCSQRCARTIIHLSVSSLRPEKVLCLCRLLVELCIVHAFHGSYIVAYGLGYMLDTLRLRALEEDIYSPMSNMEGCFRS